MKFFKMFLVVLLMAMLSAVLFAANKADKNGTSGEKTADSFSYLDDSFLDPFEEMKLMRKEMDKMFEDSFSRMKESRELWLSNNQENSPMKIDMKEKKDVYIVKLDIPGADKSSINVDVKDQMLTVKADRTETKEEKGDEKDGKFLKKERFMSSYLRQISLPEKVDAAAVKTNYKDGVLEIVIPKKNK